MLSCKYLALFFFFLLWSAEGINADANKGVVGFDGFDSDRNALKSVPPAFYDLYYENLNCVPSLYSTILTSFTMNATGEPLSDSVDASTSGGTVGYEKLPLLRRNENLLNPPLLERSKAFLTMSNVTLMPYGVLSARQSAYNAAILIPIDIKDAHELGLATAADSSVYSHVDEAKRANFSFGGEFKEMNRIPWWCQMSQSQSNVENISAARVASAAIDQLLKQARVPIFFVPSEAEGTSSTNDTSRSLSRKGKMSLYNFSLVLTTPESWNAFGMDKNLTAQDSGTKPLFFCVDCLQQAIRAYNALHHCEETSWSKEGKNVRRENTVPPFGCITSVFYRENDVWRCRPIPINDLFTVFSNSSSARSTFSMQPISLYAEKEWYRLWFSAQFNREKWKNWESNEASIFNIFSSHRIFPLFAIEYRPEDRYVVQVPPPASFPVPSNSPVSCFAWSTSSVGVWLPSGGWTLWGRLSGAGQSTSAHWKAKGRNEKEVQRTPHVVLLVPSTTLNGFGLAQPPNSSSALFRALHRVDDLQHSLNPPLFSVGGADSPVSGLVAALAIADGVRRYAQQIPSYEAILLDVFFLPAEWTGGVGSASLFEMIQSQRLKSRSAAKEEKTPATQNEGEGKDEKVFFSHSPLFFVPEDVATADMVIALDQLAMNSATAPLYFHVDGKVDKANNSVLREALSFLDSYENISTSKVLQASTVSLPSSPISRYLNYFPSSAAHAAVMTFSRYDERFINPHVFTTSDIPNDLTSAGAVAEAATVVLQLIFKNRTLAVDDVLVHRAWSCLSTGTFSACSHVLASVIDNCSSHLGSLGCIFNATREKEKGEVGFDSDGNEMYRPVLAAEEIEEEVPEVSLLRAASSFHSYLSFGERILRRWMEVVDLQVVPLPALPPELEVISLEANCWRWRGTSTAPPQASVWDRQSNYSGNFAQNKNENQDMVRHLSVYGNVFFSLSVGARITLVDPDSDVGWWMLLLSLSCCCLVLYFTWKLVL